MSQKKARRKFSGELKLNAVQRMLSGEGATAIARGIGIRRKLLYEWRDNFFLRGERAFQCGEGVLKVDPEIKSQRAELLQARQQIAELERKVGKQELEIDFFAEALRRLKDLQKGHGSNNG